jgi:hypothetical protein
MRKVARRLISEELNQDDSADTEGRAAFRVCDKLRRSLSLLTGARGFRSLLVRALSVAAAEVPWLEQLTVGLDGSLIFPAEFEGRLGRKEAAKGGTALVTHFLELLVTFIGEQLTLRLVQQVWPKAALNDPESEGRA